MAPLSIAVLALLADQVEEPWVFAEDGREFVGVPGGKPVVLSQLPRRDPDGVIPGIIQEVLVDEPVEEVYLLLVQPAHVAVPRFGTMAEGETCRSLTAGRAARTATSSPSFLFGVIILLVIYMLLYMTCSVFGPAKRSDRIKVPPGTAVVGSEGRMRSRPPTISGVTAYTRATHPEACSHHRHGTPPHRPLWHELRPLQQEPGMDRPSGAPRRLRGVPGERQTLHGLKKGLPAAAKP